MVLRGQSHSCVYVFAEKFFVPQVMWGVLRMQLPKSSIIMRIFPQSWQQHGLSLSQCPISVSQCRPMILQELLQAALWKYKPLSEAPQEFVLWLLPEGMQQHRVELLPHPLPPCCRVPQAAVGAGGGAHHLGGLVPHPPQPEHLQPAGLLLPVGEMWWDCPHSGHHVPGQVWVAVCQGGSLHWQGPGDGDHPQLQQVRVIPSDHYWEQGSRNRELNYHCKERGGCDLNFVIRSDVKL